MIRKSLFRPPWWLSNPHAQTIWQTLFRRDPELFIRRERFLLPDGDFIDLDWTGYDDAPIVLVLHGLGGSIKSPYAKGMLRTIVDQEWCGVFMHFRGASGEPNRLPRWYHSGDTTDLSVVVAEIKNRYPNRPMAAVGFSMGGNVLLKWLGETGKDNPLVGAVAVSVPFELHKVAKRTRIGFSRFYQWWLLRDLRALLNRKFERQRPPIKYNDHDLDEIHDFEEFDNKFTAPLHGFSDAFDYYSKSSSRQYLNQIQIPTLILHSADDPFMTRDVIAEANELSPYLTLEVSDYGGHVGFVTGTVPWKPRYWLEERIPEFLRELFKK